MKREISTLSEYFDRADTTLPLAIYAVLPDGTILRANHRARSLLALDPSSRLEANIRDYYSTPELRTALLAEVSRKGSIQNRLLRFTVKDKEMFVKLSCRAILNTKGYLEGYLGCIVDVTDEENYRNLFAHLPAGVYQLDRSDRIVQANLAFAKLHGYKSVDSLIGLDAKSLYANPRDAESIKRAIEEEEQVSDWRVEFKRGDDVFIGSLTAIARRDEQGEYGGREGTLLDVTAEETSRRIVADLPLGFYRAKLEKGAYLIVDCNAQFCAINDFESEEAAMGYDLAKLHSSAEDYRRFLREFEIGAGAGDPLLGKSVEIRTVAGRRKTIEVNTRAELTNGRIVGRSGVIRDISEEEELREQVTVFTRDIGRVLHVFSQTLMQQTLILESLDESLGQDPFGEYGELREEEIHEAIGPSERELVGSLQRLLTTISEDFAVRDISKDVYARLTQLLDFLKFYRERISYKQLWASTVMELSNEIRTLCAHLPGKVPRKEWRSVAAAAQEVSRILSIALIRQARGSQVAVDHEVSTLREYVTFKVRQEERWTRPFFYRLVEIARDNLLPFATYRRVDLRFEDTTRGARAEVREREVIRAIGNLLHNAIKYSWYRKAEEGERSWVRIKADADKEKVWVEVENYGVPIPHDEHQLVFSLGYRGRLSSDRGRVGTGIGLTDTLEVALSHGGDVTLESVPAAKSEDLSNLKQPFITCVKFSLARVRRRDDEASIVD